MKMRFLIPLAAIIYISAAYMKLITLKEAAARTGALCLDGSPAGYFYRPATSSKSKNKWILHIRGGGWCYDEQDCFNRSYTGYGSTTVVEQTYDIGGPLDENSNNNPDFYDWHHVAFAYCDGASFAGDVEDPIVVNGRKIYFRGFRNLKAIMNDLLTNRGLNKATDVMLNGESAGGLAVYLHADQIAEMLPKSVTRFKAAAFSGVFLDHPNAEGTPVYTPQLQYVFNMQNCSGGVDIHCLLSKSPRYMYMCMFGENSMQYMETPLFVSNSKYDGWSTKCILGAEPVAHPTTKNGNCSAVPGWAACEVDSHSCTKDQWQHISEWGEAFSSRIEANSKFTEKGNGLFEYSCHKHSAEMRFEGWDTVKVQGTLMRDALSKWFFSNNEPSEKHIYKDCSYNGDFCCNPTCCTNN